MPRPLRTLTRSLATALAAGASQPPPVFELHIRPMFRSLDREHMDFAMNLWHYPDEPGADPIAHYTLILNRLKAPAPDVVMPPPYAGGPWPQEWINLFERWLIAGAPRLGMATLDPAHLTATREPGTSLVKLTANITLPSAGHVAWLERRFADELQFSAERPDEFVVYERAMTATPANPSPLTIEDFLELPAGVVSINLTGSNGTYAVTVN